MKSEKNNAQQHNIKKTEQDNSLDLTKAAGPSRRLFLQSVGLGALALGLQQAGCAEKKPSLR